METINVNGQIMIIHVDQTQSTIEQIEIRVRKETEARDFHQGELDKFQAILTEAKAKQETLD